MKTHWFPLIRPAIRAGYFLGVNVAGGIGGVGPLDSHDINLPSVRSLLWDGFRLLALPELLSSTCLCPIDGWPGDCSVVDTSNTGDLTKLTNLFARFCPWVSEDVSPIWRKSSALLLSNSHLSCGIAPLYFSSSVTSEGELASPEPNSKTHGWFCWKRIEGFVLTKVGWFSNLGWWK